MLQLAGRVVHEGEDIETIQNFNAAILRHLCHRVGVAFPERGGSGTFTFLRESRRKATFTVLRPFPVSHFYRFTANTRFHRCAARAAAPSHTRWMSLCDLGLGTPKWSNGRNGRKDECGGRERSKNTPGENRTLNLLIRGQAPCPLGHGGIAYHVFETNQIMYGGRLTNAKLEPEAHYISHIESLHPHLKRALRYFFSKRKLLKSLPLINRNIFEKIVPPRRALRNSRYRARATRARARRGCTSPWMSTPSNKWRGQENP